MQNSKKRSIISYWQISFVGGIHIRKKGKFEVGRTPSAVPASDDHKNEQPGRKGGLSSLAKAGIIIGSFVLAAVLAVTAYGFMLMSGDTIFQNVYVAGINVGGLSRRAAVAAVDEAIADSYKSDTLTVVLPDRELVLEPEATKVALNAEEAIDQAMRYGRDSGPYMAIKLHFLSQSSEYTVDLQSSLNLDTEYIRQAIDETAEDCRSELVQPELTLDEEAKQITVVCGSPRVELDADALYDEVLARFSGNDFSPLRFDYDTEPCQAVDLQSYYDKYCTPMHDAYYDEQEHKLVAEEAGFGFDVQYYIQQIALAEAGDTIVIQMQDMTPEVTLAELEKEYFSAKLAAYDSPHVVNSARTNNLTLACKAINGTILNPGEVFSFNDTVGERTKEKGYLGATVYLAGGVSEEELGGGVCQVASTIYECCLLANLDVVERAPHMFAVTYVPNGQDATVYWGSLDYKFKNSTQHPLRIDASVSNGYVHIALLGTSEPHDYASIKLSATTLSTKPWKTVGVLNEEDEQVIEVTLGENNTATDAQGNVYKIKDTIETAYTGSTVVTYRHFLDKDGNEISKETIARSDYNKRDKKLLLELVQPVDGEEPAEGEYDEEGNYTGDPSADPLSGDDVDPWAAWENSN